MKKTIAEALTSSTLLSSSTSDNNNAHNAAKTVYKSISSAKAIIFSIGNDICTASEISMLEKNELSKNGINHLITSRKYDIDLTEKELTDGTAHVISYDLGYDWDALTEDEKNTCRKNVDLFGYLFKDNLPYACVSAVITSYKLNGKIGRVHEALSTAKSSINNLCEKFPNYEHSAALKNYYEAIEEYFSFCKIPFNSLSILLYITKVHRAAINNAELSLLDIFKD